MANWGGRECWPIKVQTKQFATVALLANILATLVSLAFTFQRAEQPAISGQAPESIVNERAGKPPPMLTSGGLRRTELQRIHSYRNE